MTSTNNTPRLERISLLLVSATAVVFVLFSIYLFRNSDENFRAVIGLVSAVSVFIPRFLYKYSAWGKHLSLFSTAVIEILLVLLLAFNGIGALGFYLGIQYYDMTLHVLSPIASGAILFIIIRSVLKNKRENSMTRASVITIILTFIGIFAWEVWELFGDTYLGTKMLGQPGEPLDTAYDIVGGIVSLGLLYALFHTIETKVIARIAGK